MSKFGDTLRTFRHSSNDPDRLNRRLTQERLGQLIGHELGDMGFSGAAISDWERGKSEINAQDRNVLIALIKVLHYCGGLKSPAEAEYFLRSGNYRALDENEARKISQEFPDKGSNFIQPASREKNSQSGRLSFLTDMFSLSGDELEALLINAREGPSPSWPRILAAFMRKATDQFSPSLTSILWMAVWLLAFWLIGPSLQLPYMDHDSAMLTMYLYVAGSLTVPLLIGMLVNTKDSEIWKAQDAVNPFLLRLYTYQGAGIGFNIGYFLGFPFALVRHYLGFEPTVWIGILAATVGLILGSMGARVVPHNLWRAYKRLTWREGGIFFIVALIGPLWGIFFLEYYSVLLTPLWGSLVILLALILVVTVGRRKLNK